MRLLACVTAIACLFVPDGVAAKDGVRNSLVKLHVTQRSPDYRCPWKKESPTQVSGSGVIIEGNRILTNAHVVLHASQVFLQANESTEKVTADVAFIAPDLDLAIVVPRDKSFFDGRKPLSLATGIPHVKETVDVYGYPEGGDQLSVTEGIISRIEYVATDFYGSVVRIQVDAALNPGNSGGPAVVDGKIAGLVFSKVMLADNIGYLVAAEEIQRFLGDVADGTYDGKPALRSVELLTSENDALRERLGLKDGLDGMVVRDLRVAKDKCPLRRWDVITAIGDHPIDRKGDVRIRDDLRLAYEYFVPKVTADGKAPMTVLRDGKRLRLDVPVGARLPYVIPFLGNGCPRYFIHGPMVFTSMTQELANNLSVPGGDYYLRYYGNPALSRQYDWPKFPGEELVVLGERLLPHEISKGYDSVSFALVKTIDGIKVKNLVHAVELIRDAQGKYLTVGTCGRYDLLVFRRQQLLDVTEEILEDEGIREQFSDDLKEVWEGKNDMKGKQN